MCRNQFSSSSTSTYAHIGECSCLVSSALRPTSSKPMGPVTKPNSAFYKPSPYIYMSENCSLVRKNPNNCHQALSQLWFLHMLLCMADWSGLSHIPSGFRTHLWVLQFNSAQSTPRHSPHVCRRYYCLVQTGPPPALAIMLSRVTSAWQRSAHSFPSRPTASARSCTCQKELCSNLTRLVPSPFTC